MRVSKFSNFEASILRGTFQAVVMTIKINKTVKIILIYFFISGGALLIINLGFGSRPNLDKLVKLLIVNGLA